MKIENKNLKAFGTTIANLRQAQNLSYRKLAQRCNLEYTHILLIEKGKVDIRLKTAFELARGLNTHPRELFNFEFDNKDQR